MTELTWHRNDDLDCWMSGTASDGYGIYEEAPGVWRVNCVENNQLTMIGNGPFETLEAAKTAAATAAASEMPAAPCSTRLLADVVNYTNDQSKQFRQCAGHHAERNRGAEAVAVRAAEILDRIGADIKSANDASDSRQAGTRSTTAWVERETRQFELENAGEWQACAAALAAAIRTGNAHGYGLRVGDEALARFDALTAGKPAPGLGVAAPQARPFVPAPSPLFADPRRSVDEWVAAGPLRSLSQLAGGAYIAVDALNGNRFQAADLQTLADQLRR